ncbi:hypothetical protein [Brasilonema sp. UFV-L1]|uniref:hypothetical protein n=1 Tax=Brasilonema sp. UFV-L1 TaxID=2234130 RepID=UPI0030DD55A3
MRWTGSTGYSNCEPEGQEETSYDEKPDDRFTKMTNRTSSASTNFIYCLYSVLLHAQDLRNWHYVP